jgi:hypothetical protein
MVSHQPKLTLGCRIRLQIKGAIYRWRFELGGKTTRIFNYSCVPPPAEYVTLLILNCLITGLAGIVGLIAYANYRLMQRRKDMKLVAELAGEAFVKLQEQVSTLSRIISILESFPCGATKLIILM